MKEIEYKKQNITNKGKFSIVTFHRKLLWKELLGWKIEVVKLFPRSSFEGECQV